MAEGAREWRRGRGNDGGGAGETEGDAGDGRAWRWGDGEVAQENDERPRGAPCRTRRDTRGERGYDGPAQR